MFEFKKSYVELYFFDEKGLKNALKKLGWKIKDNLIIGRDGIPVKCAICGKDILKEKLSCFYPSLKKKINVCCGEFSCFMASIYESRKYEESIKEETES
jgi:hypothetical protein